jgi:hypothetical protein
MFGVDSPQQLQIQATEANFAFGVGVGVANPEGEMRLQLLGFVGAEARQLQT